MENNKLQREKKIIKKYGSKGKPQFMLRMRVNSTVTSILNKLENVEFKDLAMSLYVMCGDTGFHDLAFKYQGVLEFAKVQPEKFADQLYQFYVDQGKKILEENKLSDFLTFLSFFGRTDVDHGSAEFSVFTAYYDLILEQLEFLRPNKFDVNKLVAGSTTTGEPVLINDPFPELDYPVYDLALQSTQGVKVTLNTLMDSYKKCGYHVSSIDETEMFRVQSQLFINNISCISAFINEFTTDILPVLPYAPFTELENYPGINCDTGLFENMLMHRRTTLPLSGLTVEFENSMMIKSIYIKEIYQENQIILLYKFSGYDGDTSGIYMTSEKYFYSLFRHMEGSLSYIDDFLKCVVLWVYSSYVCRDPRVMQTPESYLSYVNDNDNVSIKYYITEHTGIVNTDSRLGIRFSSDTIKYETKATAIAGYIRKLPNGQNASEQAVAFAKSIGLELDSDETYVQSFIRQNWVLRRNK